MQIFGKKNRIIDDYLKRQKDLEKWLNMH